MVKIKKPKTLDLFPEDKNVSSDEIALFLQMDPQQVKKTLLSFKQKKEDGVANPLAYYKKMSPSFTWFKIHAFDTDVYVRSVGDTFVLNGIIEGEEKGCHVLLVEEEQFLEVISSAFNSLSEDTAKFVLNNIE